MGRGDERELAQSGVVVAAPAGRAGRGPAPARLHRHLRPGGAGALRRRGHGVHGPCPRPGRSRPPGDRPVHAGPAVGDGRVRALGRALRGVGHPPGPSAGPPAGLPDDERRPAGVLPRRLPMAAGARVRRDPFQRVAWAGLLARHCQASGPGLRGDHPRGRHPQPDDVGGDEQPGMRGARGSPRAGPHGTTERGSGGRGHQPQPLPAGMDADGRLEAARALLRAAEPAPARCPAGRGGRPAGARQACAG